MNTTMWSPIERAVDLLSSSSFNPSVKSPKRKREKKKRTGAYDIKERKI